MRVPSVSPSRRPALFGVFAALLSVWILYSASVRRALLGGDLAFIPLGGELLVVTGDMESLWNEIDRHFGDIFLDEESEAGRLTEFFRDARDELDDADIRIAGIEDLVGYGLDPARGVTLGVRRFDSDDAPVDFLVLLTLADRELHGYGIVAEISDRTEGRMRLVPGNLYAVLQRLQG